jgi:hypothetical protein
VLYVNSCSQKIYDVTANDSRRMKPTSSGGVFVLLTVLLNAISRCYAKCDGTSVDLIPGDCRAWKEFTMDPLYKTWAETKCGASVHSDPCNCTFYLPTGCTGGRITKLDMFGQGLPPSGGIPLPLLDLTGLTYLALYNNDLLGPIPSALTHLTALTRLNLYNNKLTGTIPSSIGTQLSSLVELSLNNNLLTGSVPRELTNLTQLTHIAISSNPHITGEWNRCSRCRYITCVVGIALACPPRLVD